MAKYTLTNRQKEVVELRGKGLTFREIAERLNIDANTTRHHYNTAMEKLEKGKNNQYLIINLNEPYVEEIIEILKRHGHWE